MLLFIFQSKRLRSHKETLFIAVLEPPARVADFVTSCDARDLLTSIEILITDFELAAHLQVR